MSFLSALSSHIQSWDLVDNSDDDDDDDDDELNHHVCDGVVW